MLPADSMLSLMLAAMPFRPFSLHLTILVTILPATACMHRK